MEGAAGQEVNGAVGIKPTRALKKNTKFDALII
jgi:hypothetical protein